MPQDDPGLSPSELMLRSARGEESFDSPPELDFDLDSDQDAQTASVEDVAAAPVAGGLTAADIAAELAEAGALDVDDGPATEPVAHVEPTTQVAASSTHAGDAAEPLQAEPTAPADPWSEPSSEWIAREAAKPKRRRPVFVAGSVSWIRIAISAVVFGVVAFGFIGAQLDGKESVDNLAEGDCFVAGQVEEIEQVPVVACSEPHDSEVMASVEITGFGSSYPGEDPLFETLFDDCVSRFPAYVGESFETSVYYIDTWIPLLDGWNDGDRTGLCTVVQVDDNFDIVSITGSAKDSALNA